MGARKIKILSIVGARPQFVKLAVVSSALRQHKNLEEVVVHTGQHFDSDMSNLFFEDLKLAEPQYQLGIHGTGNEDIVDEMQSAIAQIIDTVKPDWVLVYGDTYSTRAGAQAAAQKGVSLAHVEAGLRSHDPKMPEEVNRIIADRLSKTLFVPTANAEQQLIREGLAAGRDVLRVGDVMMDAVRQFSEVAVKRSWPGDFPRDGFVLCTIHRAATTDDPERLANVIKGLNHLSKRYPIVFPLHPRTRNQLQAFGLSPAFSTHSPQGYLTMLQLLNQCAIVVTDSGGLQKEAYFSHKFCVTVRDETEWTELVDSGYNTLVGTDPDRLVKAVEEGLSKTGTFDEPFYGRGEASEQIAAYFAGL